MYRTSRMVWSTFGMILVGLSGTAMAAPAASKLLIATVDLQRVMAQAPGAVSRQKQLADLQASMQKQMDNLYEGRLLKDDERAELQTIQQTANPTPQQQTRREELHKLVETRNAEFNRLDKQATRTDTEQIRYTELLNILLRQKKQAEVLNTKLTQDLQTKAAALAAEVHAMVTDAINKVATNMGLDMVVDGQAVLFASKQTDITDAILKELNKSK